MSVIVNVIHQRAAPDGEVERDMTLGHDLRIHWTVATHVALSVWPIKKEHFYLQMLDIHCF